MSSGALSIAMVAALAAAAGQSPAPAGAEKLVSDWVVDPKAREAMGRNYPARAQMLAVEGLVRLRCRVNPAGKIETCEIAREDPSGFDFGEAALRMTPMFSLRPGNPKLAGGGGVTVDLNLNFRLPRSPATAILKPMQVIDPDAPAGRAEVSCQVLKAMLAGCFVVAAKPPQLGPYALKKMESFAPGDLPLGLRFTLPLIYSAAETPTSAK